MKDVNRRTVWARIVAILVVALALGVAAGCGGDDDDEVAADAPEEELLAQAAEDAEEATAPVDDFEPWNPGPAPEAQEGAPVGAVTCPFFIPACRRIANELEAAAEEIGFDPTVLDGTPDPPEQRAAVQSLLTRNVEGMVLMGFDIDAVSDLVERADEQDITVVSEATPHAAELPIIGDVNIAGGFPEAGRQLGAWVANDSGGEARILPFSADVNPGLLERFDGFQEYLEQFPGVEFVREPIIVPEGDVGPPLQRQARSILETFPEGTIDYVHAPADGWAHFIINALQELGRDEVKVVSYDGAEVNMEFIREGQNQVATQATPWGWCGWLTIDQLNRGMNDEEFVDVGCPSKVLDETNLPPEGELWDGDLDFRQEFRELWGVE